MRRRALKPQTYRYEKQYGGSFQKCGILPFNPRAVGRVSAGGWATPATTSGGEFHLDKTPYSGCEHRQQTNLALEFSKTATGGELCKVILRLSHNAEYFG